jgi:hypothetical protein
MLLARLRTWTTLMTAVGSLVLVPLGLVQPAAHASVWLSHTTNLKSAYSNLYASAEVGRSGSGAESYGVVRSRAWITGPWESFSLDYVHDQDPSAPTNEVYLYSNAANNYVSAEFGWTGDLRGTLHARSGSTTPGLWETFYVTDNGDGTISLSVYDFSGTRYYVSAEEGWSGDSYGMLRARASAIGPWERFTASSSAVSGVYSVDPGANDYPWQGLCTYGDCASGMTSCNTSNGYCGDPWGMAYGQCVSFVAWKIYEMYGGDQRPTPAQGTQNQNWWPSNPGINNDPVNSSWGVAGNWANAVGGSQTPHVGDVAEWNSYSKGMGSSGHVMMVTAVNTGTSITVAGYNTHLNGSYAVYTIKWGDTNWELPPSGSSYGNVPPWPDNFITVHP